MFKQIAYSTAVAAALLIAPTTKIFAQTTTPSAVTGGDPQPTVVSTIVLLSMIPSLAVV